jgi:hypothetical protein
MDMVKKLSKYAQHKKNSGIIVKYRVVNKNNKAVLQTQKNNREQFKDDNPTEEQLTAFLSTIDNNQPMEMDNTDHQATLPTTGNTNSSSRQRQDRPANTGTTAHPATQQRAATNNPSQTMRTTTNKPAIPPRTAATNNNSNNRRPQPSVPQPMGSGEETMRRQLEQATREAEFYKRMAASARLTSGRAGPPPTPLMGEDYNHGRGQAGTMDGIQPLRNN